MGIKDFLATLHTAAWAPDYPLVALFGCSLLVDMSHVLHVYKCALTLPDLLAVVLDDDPTPLMPVLTGLILACYSHGVTVEFRCETNHTPVKQGELSAAARQAALEDIRNRRRKPRAGDKDALLELFKRTENMLYAP